MLNFGRYIKNIFSRRNIKEDVCEDTIQKDNLPKTFYHTDTIEIDLGRPALDGSHPTAIKCSKYNYLTWKEMPSDKYLLDYYKNVYYPNAKKTWYNIKEAYDNKRALWASISERVRSSLKKYAPNYQLSDLICMDIGCAFGGMVDYFNKNGINCYGLDLNPIPILEGHDYGNDKIYNLDIETFINELKIIPNFYVSYHCLEHFSDPFTHIEQIYSVLPDNGFVLYYFPNGNHYNALIHDYSHYGYYAFPDHLHLFGPYSTFRLFEDRGFKILDLFSFQTAEEWIINDTVNALSPFHKELIDYGSFAKALELNYCASSLCVLCCKGDSDIERQNTEQCERMNLLEKRFESLGM